MQVTLAVTLAGELRVYNGQHLMTTTQLSSPYNAMTFGKYGREDSTLIGIMKSGEHHAGGNLGHHITFVTALFL